MTCAWTSTKIKINCIECAVFFYLLYESYILISTCALFPKWYEIPKGSWSKFLNFHEQIQANSSIHCFVRGQLSKSLFQGDANEWHSKTNLVPVHLHTKTHKWDLGCPIIEKNVVSCFDIGEVPRSPGKWNWNWLYFLPFIFTFEQGVKSSY